LDILVASQKVDAASTAETHGRGEGSHNGVRGRIGQPNLGERFVLSNSQKGRGNLRSGLGRLETTGGNTVYVEWSVIVGNIRKVMNIIEGHDKSHGGERRKKKKIER